MMPVQNWIFPDYFSQYFLVIFDKPVTPSFNLFELRSVGVVSMNDAIELIFDVVTFACAHDLAKILPLSFQRTV